MIIISHRGYWQKQHEKNTEHSFIRSFSLGFGTETDVRDCNGELVIAHDIPKGSELKFKDFLSLINHHDIHLAINIKSDGLAKLIRDEMLLKNIKNWFVFDMSVPDMRSHIELGNPVFARMSEVEKDPAWFDQVEGVWLDSFTYEWFDRQLVRKLLEQNKKVCIVSPELHKRDHRALWEKLLPLRHEKRIFICTDFPEMASDFFGSKHD
jgi:glycerophosphoryl diester phosphodiesterase